MSWTIGLVENEDQFRNHIKSILKKINKVDRILDWPSAEHYWRDEKGKSLDLIFLDVKLAYMDGVELAKQIKSRSPEIRIAMLTNMATDEKIFGALKAGAMGYILKSEIQSLPETVDHLMNNRAIITPTIAFHVMRSFHEQPPAPAKDTGLTSRENQVLELLTSGLSIKKAADRMGISENTLRVHVHRIYKKLNVRSQLEMAHKARELGFG